MKEELIVHEDPKAPISETFRTLRTNLQFMHDKERLQTILITSTLPQEGKSFVSANLAVAFAQAGKNVLLVDADMRKGRQYKIFDLLPKPGLSNYLLDISQDEKEIKDYIQSTEIENLSVITSGSIPPNPSELLISEAMLNTIATLREKFDIIILDGPPVELVTDSIILTSIVDTTAIVVACNETRKDNLHKVVNAIKNVGGNIAGVIVNKVKTSNKEYKYSYYYGTEKRKERVKIK